MDLIVMDPQSRQPLYMQLYQHYRGEIEQGRLAAGARLPSIRSLADSLSVSKITVEKAYQQLMSEGYIDNSERSRYRVNQVEPAFPTAWPTPETPTAAAAPEPVYDFASGEMDSEGFDFSLWKRYINKAFMYKNRLMGYGSGSGEPELRAEIAAYLHHSRGVCASAEQIVIGAGVQSLLNTLCSILKETYGSIAFEEPGFKNGRQIFTDRGFSIIPARMRADGLDMAALRQSAAQLIYVSPSHQFPTGYIMPVGKRRQLLNWAEQVEGIIIEDDYDSEFRYYGRPIPALKGLDRREAVVYLGSFSKVLPPSIRISYMVLPERLLAVYRRKAALYKQTASTTEQLALARYMADGHLERQIRRLRKRYYEKSLAFIAGLKEILADKVVVKETESGLHTIIQVRSAATAAQLVEQALVKGCRVAAVDDFYLRRPRQDLPQIMLYFSKIAVAEIPVALTLLRQAWFS
ncbi:MAG: PLP-dependent aminotransferase family protein [Sporomusaceae bacterium]|nr:PLP-dependent aminotransferase family protein [Sporomusaceae bacterium]